MIKAKSQRVLTSLPTTQMKRRSEMVTRNKLLQQAPPNYMNDDPSKIMDRTVRLLKGVNILKHEGKVMGGIQSPPIEEKPAQVPKLPQKLSQSG